MIVSVKDYVSQIRTYEIDKKEAEDDLIVRVYSAVRPEIVKPPEPLSIFSRGISYNVGSKVKIFLGEIPMLSTGRSSIRDNPFLNRFFSIDFITVIAIVMSLLGLLFTYDSCTGEREQGTLKLILANDVNRWKILLGKVIGVLFTLFPIILFCFVVSAIIILFQPQISFSIAEWIRIIFLFLFSLLFVALFMAIGLFISTRVRSSVTSVIICLFVWVVIVFIIPNMAIYTAQSFISTGSQDNLQFKLNDLGGEYEDKCDEYREKLEQPDMFMHWNYNTGYDGFKELYGSTGSLMEFYRELNQFTEPLRIDYADKKWSLQKVYLDNLDKQRNFSEILSLFSFSELFRSASSALCRTDVQSHYHFLDRTRIYREEFIDFFKNENIFASYEYFTRQPQETFKTADEIFRTRTGGQFQTVQEYGEWQESHNGDFSPLFKVDIPGTNPGAYNPLDLSNIPRFQLESSTLVIDLKRCLGKLALLAIICIILFYLSFVSFARYDVR